MQAIIITGVLAQPAETRQAGGSDVLTFSVGVTQGFGQNKSTNWFRCNLWGARGQKLARYLVKGTKVAVSGELEIREYQGKPQYEVNVSNVDLMGGGERQQGAQQRQAAPAKQANAFGDDLDDDVPF